MFSVNDREELAKRCETAIAFVACSSETRSGHLVVCSHDLVRYVIRQPVAMGCQSYLGRRIIHRSVSP